MCVCVCVCLCVTVELAWRSGSVFDCHATGSIPGGNGASRPSQGTVNGDAVPK